MIKNYFLTALRNLRTTKTFSLINIFGLAIGISAALVIYLIVDFDLSFEDFQPNANRIYRVVTDVNFNGEALHLAAVPYPFPSAARKEITGLAECSAIWPANMKVIPAQPGNSHPNTFRGQYMAMTDAHYFKLFRFYTWLAGSGDALDIPYHTVLCASRAAAYFPGLSPAQIIGKTIYYGDSITSTVTGVVSDPPTNTDISWQEFLSISAAPHTSVRQYTDPNDWGNIHGTYRCMVELTPGTKPASIDRQLTRLRRKYSSDTTDIHRLQPLSDIHFNATYDAFYRRMAHKPSLYGLMLVAAFLLLLGCINFINLTTANAAHRAKEIGIRKTLGGSQPQLLLQFLGETFLLTLAGLTLSLLLIPSLLRAFADFIPASLHFQPLQQPRLWLFAGTLLLSVTALAGYYPSWILSRFKPVLVLKNQAFSGSGNTRSAMLRKTLTIFQFLIAQAFIMATIVVGRQLHYSLTADLGFKKDAIVYFATPYAYGKPDNNRFVLLNRLQSIPGIQRAGVADIPPTFDFPVTNELRYTDGKKINIDQQIQVRIGDSNYIRIYHLPLLAGRNLQPSDSVAEFLINQSYCRLLGFKKPEDAIGKNLMDGNQTVPIVGVIPDFHQENLHAPIKPLVIAWSNKDQYNIHIALQPQTPDGRGWKQTLAKVETEFRAIYPGKDFDLVFLDETIAKYYNAEQQLSRLLRWATGLTIGISCLGLAGLVIFTTNTKRKEIGIRKVLGASITSIVTGLSKEFVNLLLIAFVVATPIAWWAVHKWLESFAYRVPVSWWTFPLAGGTMMGFALLTMSIRTIRSAMANPATALRSD